ncbi:MAG TPA: long-chain fatty acid--CoA ligase, partial [Anaerolineae bacterium]|nr:long-chain fatty acid--CoA ligase [Anaerolineae bacterium]
MMNEPQTIPQYFLQKVQQYGDTKIALRQKELGIWKGYTWQESNEQVKNFALGLIALGLQRGEQVASIGDNDRQYLWAFLAVQAVG